jgi:hypothetical protein
VAFHQGQDQAGLSENVKDFAHRLARGFRPFPDIAWSRESGVWTILQRSTSRISLIHGSTKCPQHGT